jgi:hypothetical protein
MDKEKQRGFFERWISAPPYEMDVRRISENHSMWPGMYTDYTVEIAWAAWRQALRKQSLRQAASDKSEKS